MKSIKECLDIINNDKEIQDILADMDLNAKSTSNEMKNFWFNDGGAMLRNLLSIKYGFENSRGCIKDAIILYMGQKKGYIRADL